MFIRLCTSHGNFYLMTLITVSTNLIFFFCFYRKLFFFFTFFSTSAPSFLFPELKTFAPAQFCLVEKKKISRMQDKKKEKKNMAAALSFFIHVHILVPYKTCALNTKWNSL